MIIIMGAIGSGKSEQATRLAASLGCPHISTSRLLQENLTPELEAKMHAGELISDEKILGLLDKELAGVRASTNQCVLDGAPRSVIQAEWLVKKQEAGQIKIDSVIKLNVSDQTVLNRLLKRGREDDTKEVILHRLSEYTKITEPVVEYFRQQGVGVHEINGELSLDEVEAEIKKVIN